MKSPIRIAGTPDVQSQVQLGAVEAACRLADIAVAVPIQSIQ